MPYEILIAFVEIEATTRNAGQRGAMRRANYIIYTVLIYMEYGV